MSERFTPNKENLTRVEGEAYGLQMTAHRARKCRRCRCREDLEQTCSKIHAFVCMVGRDVDRVMAEQTKTCTKFILDEDSSRWLA